MTTSRPSFTSHRVLGTDLYGDVLVIGAGLAGLTTALAAAEAGLSVLLAFKPKDATESNSAYAQGGIAAYVEWNTPDSLEQHVQDTLEAGAGYNKEDVVRQILAEGNEAIKTLMRYGVAFDLDPEGVPALTQEGAHSQRRILHVNGDQTGVGIVTPLIERVKASEHIQILPYHALEALHQGKNQAIVGATLYDTQHAEFRVVHTPNVVLATGGYAGLYLHATNTATDGVKALFLAHQAGAKLKDLHLVQFHPTAFVTQGEVRFLASESLRGEGALLVNADGQRFMQAVHPQGELAPRDVVARAIASEMIKTAHPCVYLDMRHTSKAFLEQRFPNIYHTALRYGIDMATDLLPVAPAAHYCMGGIEATWQGKTAVSGLFAIGEASCTGLHGANRLASNSLLECVVMGRNVVDILEKPLPSNDMDALAYTPHPTVPSTSQHKDSGFLNQLKKLMWQYLGLQRSQAGYDALRLEIKRLEALFSHEKDLAFLVNTALRHAEAMHSSCGSHHVLEMPLSLK
jgi:L-aspartate oxidase